MRTRENILNEILSYKKDLDCLVNELSNSNSKLTEVCLTEALLHDILSRYLKGHISSSGLKKWATIIELTEDIEYESDIIAEYIFLIATPEINGDITIDSIRKMRNKLKQ